METKKTGSNAPNTVRRQYDADFKRSAVQLVLNGQSVPSVSQSLGIGESMLYKWKSEVLGVVETSSPQSGLMEENALLRRQVRQLELERDILKKALAIFSRVT